LSLLGLGFDYLLHAFATTITWLFIGRLIAGICGASYTTATAYIADVSTKEERAKNFGLIGAAFGLGFIIGPALGGIFGNIDVRLPFFVAAGLSFANFLFGYFFVPESLAVEHRREPIFSKMLPGVSLANLGRYKGLGLLIIALFLANIASQVLPATWSFFTMEVYEWNEAQVGYSLSFIGLLVALVQGGLIGIVVKKFGQKKVILTGFILWSIGMFLFAFANQSWMLYAILIPYALGGVAGPTLQGLLSNQVSEREQGNLQGALTSMISLTTIIGPAIATTLFYTFTQDSMRIYFPGAPYFASAMLLISATVCVLVGLRRFER
jgi:MFS transporter, DHA1 family, tetracycline resistance protein